MIRIKTNPLFERIGWHILLLLGIGLLLLFINALLVIGVMVTVDSFYEQTNPFNDTFESGINNTYYIPIPLYAYVNNITISIDGVS